MLLKNTLGVLRCRPCIKLILLLQKHHLFGILNITTTICLSTAAFLRALSKDLFKTPSGSEESSGMNKVLCLSNTCTKRLCKDISFLNKENSDEKNA